MLNHKYEEEMGTINSYTEINDTVVLRLATKNFM
ncbi:hypothetical protein FH603_5514 [Spirosoma sp. LMG 31447]|uniref:Uncharacterized protein n=1 Tax=Spirosoma utsteinense TaxID=2585773 RepID=A0ABR6WG87_9BACT|nr:hypothetical protein [Spirosoma utsteinense]